MRLIDADALEKWIADRVKNYHKSFPDWRKTHPISVETALLELDCIKDVVRGSLTIDAAPVVHARWGNEIDDGYTPCTNCGWKHPILDQNLHAVADAYCPSCGSKMDGGESDV